jgi:hypothetical protein
LIGKYLDNSCVRTVNTLPINAETTANLIAAGLAMFFASLLLQVLEFDFQPLEAVSESCRVDLLKCDSFLVNLLDTAGHCIQLCIDANEVDSDAFDTFFSRGDTGSEFRQTINLPANALNSLF